MITLYIILIVVTYLWIKFDSTISIDVLNSELFGDGKEGFPPKPIQEILYALVAPITLLNILIIKNKQKLMKNTIVTIAIIILLLFSIKYVVTNAATYYNQSVNLELAFNKKSNERLVILDRITKIVHQKLEVAQINDSSYYKNLLAVTISRTDNSQLFWKWVKENNPNANYEEVSKFYSEVNASIDEQRNMLFTVETEMQKIVYDYEVLHRVVPSSWFLFYRSSKLQYKPISTELNKIINSTGIDNNISLKQ